MKTLTLVLLTLCSLSFFGCDQMSAPAAGSPEAIVSNFLGKIKEKDFVGVKEYTSSETGIMMDFLAEKEKMLKKMNKQDSSTIFGELNLGEENAIIDCKELEDKAICNLCKDDKKEECSEIFLIKENGKWVVHMPKDADAQ